MIFRQKFSLFPKIPEESDQNAIGCRNKKHGKQSHRMVSTKRAKEDEIEKNWSLKIKNEKKKKKCNFKQKKADKKNLSIEE